MITTSTPCQVCADHARELRDQKRRAEASFYRLMEFQATWAPSGRYQPVTPRCRAMGHVMDFWRVQYAYTR